MAESKHFFARVEFPPLTVKFVMMTGFRFVTSNFNSNRYIDEKFHLPYYSEKYRAVFKDFLPVSSLCQLGRRHSQTFRYNASSNQIYYVAQVWELLNIKENQNSIIGSKATRI